MIVCKHCATKMLGIDYPDSDEEDVMPATQPTMNDHGVARRDRGRERVDYQQDLHHILLKPRTVTTNRPPLQQVGHRSTESILWMLAVQGCGSCRVGVLSAERK